MHAELSRARQHQQGRPPRLAAALCLALACILAPAAAAGAAPDPTITGSLPPPQAHPVTHELRIEHTAPGREGLELAARLSEDSNLVTRPVGWTVLRAGGDGLAGEPVFSDEAPVSDVRLSPGDYRIEAQYGAVRASSTVHVQPGQRIGVTLVLNVGGLRTMANVAGSPLPLRAQAVHDVFHADGRQAGLRVASSAVQGELFRLGAGFYRIESRITPGNTRAEARVTVKPGILSTIEIAHQAGIARLDAPDLGPWTLTSLATAWRAEGRGRDDLVLAPGDYQLTATVGTRQVSRTVVIEAGTRTDVDLSR